MKTDQFKTIKNPTQVSKYHISLTEEELSMIEKDVIRIRNMGVHPIEQTQGFERTFTQINEFMRVLIEDRECKEFEGPDNMPLLLIGQDVKKWKKEIQFKNLGQLMFCFGLLLSKVIITKYGGAVIKDSINGEIDVIVPHGNMGGYRIFYPGMIILEMFDGHGRDVKKYLAQIDDVMARQPNEIISEVIQN